MSRAFSSTLGSIGSPARGATNDSALVSSDGQFGSIILTFALTIGGVRGVNTGSPGVLVIRAGTPQVRIQLRLRENDNQGHQAVLQPARGKEIFSRQSLEARTDKSGAAPSPLPFLLTSSSTATTSSR
jgi:hypothetical protein